MPNIINAINSLISPSIIPSIPADIQDNQSTNSDFPQILNNIFNSKSDTKSQDTKNPLDCISNIFNDILALFQAFSKNNNNQNIDIKLKDATNTIKSDTIKLLQDIKSLEAPINPNFDSNTIDNIINDIKNPKPNGNIEISVSFKESVSTSFESIISSLDKHIFSNKDISGFISQFSFEIFYYDRTSTKQSLLYLEAYNKDNIPKDIQSYISYKNTIYEINISNPQDKKKSPDQSTSTNDKSTSQTTQLADSNLSNQSNISNDSQENIKPQDNQISPKTTQPNGDNVLDQSDISPQTNKVDTKSSNAQDEAKPSQPHNIKTSDNTQPDQLPTTNDKSTSQTTQSADSNLSNQTNILNDSKGNTKAFQPQNTKVLNTSQPIQDNQIKPQTTQTVDNKVLNPQMDTKSSNTQDAAKPSQSQDVKSAEDPMAQTNNNQTPNPNNILQAQNTNEDQSIEQTQKYISIKINTSNMSNVEDFPKSDIKLQNTSPIKDMIQNVAQSISSESSAFNQKQDNSNDGNNQNFNMYNQNQQNILTPQQTQNQNTSQALFESIQKTILKEAYTPPLIKNISITLDDNTQLQLKFNANSLSIAINTNAEIINKEYQTKELIQNLQNLGFAVEDITINGMPVETQSGFSDKKESKDNDSSSDKNDNQEIDFVDAV